MIVNNVKIKCYSQFNKILNIKTLKVIIYDLFDIQILDVKTL